MSLIETYTQKILAGKNLQFGEALELASTADPAELYQAADALRRKLHKNSIDLCSIVNAKSGKCSEDCKFCAQSSHYDVEVASYDVVDVVQAVTLARQNEQHGVKRFSLVSAGRTVSEKHLEEFRVIYRRLREETNLSFCASMGFLSREKAEKLKDMGVTRYHCNLETCRSFFPEVCSSHTWDEKVATIKTAQDVGLDVCSGGDYRDGREFRTAS